MKKFLLVAINAKYIHSSPAIRCLKAASGIYENNVKLAEFTINNRMSDILRGIYEENADYIGISCYIWNMELVGKIIKNLALICPNVPIWLGGPEVSYNAQEVIDRYPEIAGVIKGEGEDTFRRLLECYMEQREADIENIKGLATKDFDNECPDPVNFSLMKMPYESADRLRDCRNKIIYYESGRGCPFSCSYCLSSVDKKVRFKSMDVVKKDLKYFIDNDAAQVKFVDRTFNCKKEHALEIWKFIKENDKGITNFHFEIAADLLDDEQIEILNSMRTGLVQLEIGVQSTNLKTIEAIHRKMNLEVLRNNVDRLSAPGNIHLHLDLIAGLPYEDYESFGRSFDDVYDMQPDALQMGFLKLLHGSLMRFEAEKYGIKAMENPPYEVLCTDYLSYGDIIKLKKTERVLDIFYNSGKYKSAMKYMVSFYDRPFHMYEQMGEFFDGKYPKGALASEKGKNEFLQEFAAEFIKDADVDILSECINKKL